MKDKLIYSIFNNGAKLEEKTTSNGRKYKVLKLDDKEFRYNPTNISKQLTQQLDKISDDDKFKTAQEI